MHYDDDYWQHMLHMCTNNAQRNWVFSLIAEQDAGNELDETRISAIHDFLENNLIG